MDISTIYAARSLPRNPLPEAIAEIILKLKISFKPVFRRPFVKRREPESASNWRETAIINVVRKVREKEDPDYDEINAIINKLSKQTFDKLIAEILAKLEKHDALFRLRVTTLLFDRGIRQNFYATIMADTYAAIAKKFPDAIQDLATQVEMFDRLYDVSNVTMIPSSEDAGYDAAVIAWTKQKETKRGFAVYVAELYTRGLIPAEKMELFVTTVFDDLRENIGAPKTPMKEEHVDALVRFVAAVAPSVPKVKIVVREILAMPKTETPSLNMKSRFKLQDIGR